MMTMPAMLVPINNAYIGEVWSTEGLYFLRNTIYSVQSLLQTHMMIPFFLVINTRKIQKGLEVFLEIPMRTIKSKDRVRFDEEGPQRSSNVENNEIEEVCECGKFSP